MGEGVVPTRSDIFRSSRTDKQGRPMNAAAERIFGQLEEVGSQGDPDSSGPHDFLSQVLGPEHSGRIRCRPGYMPTGYWSTTSSSSHVSGVTVSQEQLDTALVQVAQARQESADMRQELAGARQESAHLRSVMTAMLTRLSTTFGDDYLSLHDMLNATPAAPVPPAPAAAPPGPAAAPPGPAPAPPGPAPAPPGPAPAPPGPATAPPDPAAVPLGDDDDIFDDFDLQDF